MAVVVAGCSGDTGDAAPPAAPQDVCGKIDRLDPSEVLGGQPTDRIECRPDNQLAVLGAAVWTAEDGRRVSVSINDNDKARSGAGSAPFDHLYRQASEEQRCRLTLSEPPKARCIDKIHTGSTETGTIIIDQGATYAVVWMSHEDGQQTGVDINADDRPVFLRFVSQALERVYGHSISDAGDVASAAPATAGAPTATAPSSSADTQASPSATATSSLTPELEQAGYQRSMRGSYFAEELGRRVAIEDWTHPTDSSLPVAQLSAAPPGTADRLALSQLTYQRTGEYENFWCVPDDEHALKFAYVFDQAKFVRQRLDQGISRPEPAPNDTFQLASFDASVTCYMK
ncbi:hypothetical protein ACFO9E_03605 [Streptomyces maoxianensis]|uniref:DUF3558 domain-containing protein n=1 Tax=Streptomyces maoxianensis TaxID=1459942 RepID=A0ABV9FY25_9ACTN